MGVALGVLGRSAEAIPVYDDLLARFGTAPELPLCELADTLFPVDRATLPWRRRQAGIGCDLSPVVKMPGQFFVSDPAAFPSACLAVVCFTEAQPQVSP
jgi:hypothetical protein